MQVPAEGGSPPHRPPRRRVDDHKSVSLDSISVSTLTLPPDRPYTRDDVPYQLPHSFSGSDSAPLPACALPRAIVEERPLCADDDDEDGVASYDDDLPIRH